MRNIGGALDGIARVMYSVPIHSAQLLHRQKHARARQAQHNMLMRFTLWQGSQANTHLTMATMQSVKYEADARCAMVWTYFGQTSHSLTAASATCCLLTAMALCAQVVC